MPSTKWNIKDAKDRFNEVLDHADHEAQTITRQDQRYILIREDHYNELANTKPTLKDLILNGPSLEGVDLERDQSPAREIEL